MGAAAATGRAASPPVPGGFALPPLPAGSRCHRCRPGWFCHRSRSRCHRCRLYWRYRHRFLSAPGRASTRSRQGPRIRKRQIEGRGGHGGHVEATEEIGPRSRRTNFSFGQIGKHDGPKAIPNEWRIRPIFFACQNPLEAIAHSTERRAPERTLDLDTRLPPIAPQRAISVACPCLCL